MHKYATLVKSARRAIHGADHKANVILAGMSGRGHPSDKKFLNRFYRERRIKRSFDAVAVNPYAPKVKQVGAKIKRIRGVMRRHGDKRTALWISESVGAHTRRTASASTRASRDRSRSSPRPSG